MSLLAKVSARQSAICLYGLAPPKRATEPVEIDAIVARQQARLASLGLDGLVVYDLQEEQERMSAPRPFPFLPTVDPLAYAHEHLVRLDLPKIVYRCVSRDTTDGFIDWLRHAGRVPSPFAVLVGAPSRHCTTGLRLTDAYRLARQHAPDLVLGGIAIAERHARSADEHERLLAKTEAGCRFFVTQAVYDVTATKSLLSDYALAARRRGVDPVPIILTFAPCGSERTLAFMQWLGIAFPRWLENDLRHAPDPLAISLTLCEKIFAEVWEYAADKRIPIGLNVESVSIRQAEIQASVELLRRLRAVMASAAPAPRT
jgi:hypothetical protein